MLTPSSLDVDHLLAAGGQVLADVVGPDGQLPVAPVDHHRQLHRPGPPVVAEGVEGGPDGAPGEQDVVDQHHHLPGQVERDVGGGLGQHRPQADVVAVEGHVERAHRDLVALDLLRATPAIRRASGHAAGLQADQDHVVEAAVALGDLVGHAGRRPVDVGGREDLGVGNENATQRSGMAALAFGHRSSCPYGPHGTRFTVRIRDYTGRLRRAPTRRPVCA